MTPKQGGQSKGRHSAAASPLCTVVAQAFCLPCASLQNLQLLALLPAWVRTLCPNVESFQADECLIAPRSERPGAAPAAAAAPPDGAPSPPAPVTPCGRLQRLIWREGDAFEREGDRPLLDLVRRQLASLPSLTSLHAGAGDLAALDDDAEPGAALSTSLTALTLSCDRDGLAALLPRVGTLFPALRAVEVSYHTVGDADLAGMLRHLAHLDDVSFYHFDLKRSYTRLLSWPWPRLVVAEVDVGSFARLPLEGIRSCCISTTDPLVRPSTDAQAVARVAEAVRRWGGLGVTGELGVWGARCDALLATLGPLLAALPEQQQRRVALSGFGRGTVTAGLLERLGVALPPGVKQLALVGDADSLEIDQAWRAVLPSLPATVEQLELRGFRPEVDQLVQLCECAPRRVRVLVPRATDWELAEARVSPSMSDITRLTESFRSCANLTFEQIRDPRRQLVTLVNR